MMDSVYSYGDGGNRPPTAFLFGSRFLASKVYQRSPAEVSINYILGLIEVIELYISNNMCSYIGFNTGDVVDESSAIVHRKRHVRCIEAIGEKLRFRQASIRGVRNGFG